MNQDNRIQSAIDESLGAVHFNAHDAQNVMHAVRAQKSPRRTPVRSKRMRLDLVFAAVMIMAVAIPVSRLVLHALHTPTQDIRTSIAASGGDTTPAIPGEEPLQTAQQPIAISESAAVQTARACFEDNCDTAVFSFDEYTVDVQKTPADEGSSFCYEVTMHSVYDNGCTFSVAVDAASGQTLSFSAPQNATQPSGIRTGSEEVLAWYDKHGSYRFTWPMDVQAEFSRRYEGAMLRMPREGEKDAQYIAACIPGFLDKLIENADEGRSFTPAWYPMLYDGRAAADGQARYRIYCFALDAQTQQPLDAYLLATMLAADGTLESTEILPLSSLSL